MTRKCLSISKKQLLPYSCMPPRIITQPISQQITDGDSLSFTVVASGSPTLKYQWYRNGLLLVNKISAILNIIYADINDAGSYTVKVYNNCGFVISAVALLIVNGSGSFINILSFVVNRGLGTPYFDPISTLDNPTNIYVNANLNGKTYVVFRPGFGALVWGVHIQLISGGGFQYIDGTVFYDGEAYTIFIIS